MFKLAIAFVAFGFCILTIYACQTCNKVTGIDQTSGNAAGGVSRKIQIQSVYILGHISSNFFIYTFYFAQNGIDGADGNAPGCSGCPGTRGGNGFGAGAGVIGGKGGGGSAGPGGVGGVGGAEVNLEDQRVQAV